MRKCDCKESIASKQVLLSLGSNLGDSSAVIKEAVRIIAEENILSDIISSHHYLTAPVGFTDQPAFINSALLGKTTHCPHELLEKFKQIENELGRILRRRWHEREIDIDIVLYGEMIINEDELIIPHERMTERNFVLIPCAEIASEMINPKEHKTIGELLLLSEDKSEVIKIE